MKKIIDNILKSFNNQDEGFSSRKLTAFVIIVCVVIAHIKWIILGDFKQLEMVLTIDYGFIATLFGMTTYSSLKTTKTEPPLDPPSNPPAELLVEEKKT
jgi:hypothetical protein